MGGLRLRLVRVGKNYEKKRQTNKKYSVGQPPAKKVLILVHWHTQRNDSDSGLQLQQNQLTIRLAVEKVQN